MPFAVFYPIVGSVARTVPFAERTVALTRSATHIVRSMSHPAKK